MGGSPSQGLARLRADLSRAGSFHPRRVHHHEHPRGVYPGPAQADGFPWLVTVALLHYISLAHLMGGLMLTVGLLTRIASWVQIPILAGALLVHRREGLMSSGQSLEFSSLVFFLLVVFSISGSGPLSVDNGMPKLKPAITP
ncbi:MAG: DoxX family protein [Opitutaceae bacterium]|nr:DoxX family protein [Opitutaceae bacterium]